MRLAGLQARGMVVGLYELCASILPRRDGLIKVQQAAAVAAAEQSPQTETA